MRQAAVFILILTFVASGQAVTSASLPLPEMHWHHGIFRINTTISAGKEDPRTVAQKASEAGMSFAVFSDQFVVRAEYGLPPFRNLFKVRREQNSVVRYGIERYLQELAQLDEEFPQLTVVPAVDVAPDFTWSGNPLKRNLVCHQFSQQLTVFGSDTPAFYRDLPVILNERTGWRFPQSLIRLSPLLIAAIGILLLIVKPPEIYRDFQGNSYRPSALKRRIAGSLLILLGLLWTVDKRPFTIGNGISPYQDQGIEPYQKLIDYVRKNGDRNTGIIWSAPEITHRQQIHGVTLLTQPYLPDVENTRSHNGMAGIYGDVAHAHKPGKSWDKMLIQYCSGQRDVRPVIVGELDYHADRPIDLIQTVIHSPAKPGRRTVVRSIVEGKSYATVKRRQEITSLKSATLRTSQDHASLGQTLSWNGKDKITFQLSGRTESAPSSRTLRIITVLDGEQISEQTVSAGEFSFSQPIYPTKHDLQKHYLRFYVNTGQSPLLIANPIFIRREEKDDSK